jgi:hypothetical protein
VATLRIAARWGRRPTYERTARAHIVAVAQEQPRRREDQTATWSPRMLQRRLRREGLGRLGASTIRRVLQQAGSSYQRTRTCGSVMVLARLVAATQSAIVIRIPRRIMIWPLSLASCCAPGQLSAPQDGPPSRVSA